jgi:predicted ATPase
MRIREIRVFGLFDLFDHVIPLNQDERVTILHGPNGFGKTAVLRLLRALFECDYEALNRVPFGALELDLGADGTLRVERTSTEKETGLRFTRTAPGGVKTWRPERRDEPWYETLPFTAPLRVRFITTQRLLARREAPKRLSLFQQPQPLSVVKELAIELATRIEETQAAYGRRAQELDREFPARLLQRNTHPALTVEELQRRLREIEQKNQRLVTAGLLDAQSAVAVPVEKVDEEARSVLSVFVTDAEKKLGVFDDLLARVELLREVVGRRFLFKTLITGGEHGIQFKTVKGKTLDLDDLSSGEQHELVLLYDLLFCVERGALVLLDEPEISLHISWQNEFIDDLSRVVKLCGFDVLLATHSPDIIGKHWDLTVELKAPPELAARA